MFRYLKNENDIFQNDLALTNLRTHEQTIVGC